MLSASRSRATLVSRALTLASVGGALASYLYQPAGLFAVVADVVVRAYLHFVAGVMAHEGVHGHMGNTRWSNDWWGRLALLPTTVPYVTFRKTHLHHHSATNIPELDPDEFLSTPHWWQIPLRAFLLPYHWMIWMWRHGKFTRRDLVEYGLHYAGIAVVYGAFMSVAGWERVLTGLLASATLHSFLLWYWCAIKTHEGYSTGAAATRSHTYDSRFLYWLSFGLSLHQVHHMQPRLAWLEMRSRI